jgi:hypothetical protein
MINTYKIHESNMETLEKLIDKMNKKAVKLSQSKIVSRTINEEYVEITSEDGEKSFSKYFNVEIEAETIKVSGYEFIATLNHTYEGGNIINTIKSYTEELPERFRTSSGECQHCNTNRKRKETIVLKNIISGEFIQIGRNCCKDFFGYDIHNEAQWLNSIKSIEEEISKIEKAPASDRYAKHVDLKHLIMMVFELVKRHGYINKAKSEEFGISTTCNWAVKLLMNPVDKYTTEEELAILDCYRENSQNADEALSWIRNHDKVNPSDYMNNLIVMCSGEYVGYRETGFAGSLVATYHNWLHREEEKKAKAEKKPSEYVGEVGQRLEFTATVKNQFCFDNQFGVTYITLLETPEGNVLKWSGNGHGMDKNLTYTFKGTIKEHSEYKEIKQTVLTRCMNIKEVIEEPAQ